MTWDDPVVREIVGHLPIRAKTSTKNDNGWVLVVAGCAKMPGAAVLAVMGAYRAGAGRVSIASVKSVTDVVAHHVPEALLVPLPKKNGCIDPSSFERILDEQSRCDAAVFGPGMSSQFETGQLLKSIWPEWSKPGVIDADALNAIASRVEPPKCAAVFTPHEAEMGRLLEMSPDSVHKDRKAVAVRACRQFQTTVVLKGANSIVASPSQPVFVNDSGNSGMASAGMGDVLSGVIATLLAQRLDAHDAGCLGAIWHGLAGEIAAETIGEVGFLASDLALLLPQARDFLLEVRERKG